MPLSSIKTGGGDLKLHYTAASPYVRKVVVTAIEVGLDGEIERVTPTVSLFDGEGDSGVNADNPLGKVPTLITREGIALVDSSLICEYLSSLAPERGLLPANGDERWEVLSIQALAQGLLDAVVSRALETHIRPDNFSWPGWVERQSVKIERALDAFEQKLSGDAPLLASGVVNLGAISLACTLGYMVARLGVKDWRRTHAALSSWVDEFSQRESMLATVPPPIPPA